MKVKFEIKILLPSEEEAMYLVRAISPENYTYLRAEATNRFFIAKGTSDNIGSLMHTLEDLLACVHVYMSSVAVLREYKSN